MSFQHPNHSGINPQSNGPRSSGFDNHPPNSDNNSNPYSIIAMVFGGISFLLFPVVFGPAAIIMSLIGRNKGERLANIALAVGILGLLIGALIGAVIGSMAY